MVTVTGWGVVPRYSDIDSVDLVCGGFEVFKKYDTAKIACKIPN